jgi:SNF2 family DNA or RNA helicase
MKVSDTASIKGCCSSLLIGESAHHIRNRSSQAFKAACAISSQRRWCLTGTPIQNSLDDYGALLSFLGIPPFKDKSNFDFWIAAPLKNGRADSLWRLKDLIRATCLRRTKRTLGDSCELPKRTERIERVEFDGTDQDLYAFFKEKCAKIAEGGSTTKLGSTEVDQRKEGNLLSLINFLRLICDHGEQLLPRPAVDAWKARDGTSINWQMMQNWRKRCCIWETDIEEGDFLASNGYEPRCQHWICTICASQVESASEEEGICPKCATSSSSGDDSIFPYPADTCLPPSAKIEALLRNLHTEQVADTSQGPSKPVKRSLITILFKCYQCA